MPSRELERQIRSGAALRSAPGAKKVSAVLTLTHPTAIDELENAYNLEFLALANGLRQACNRLQAWRFLRLRALASKQSFAPVARRAAGVRHRDYRQHIIDDRSDHHVAEAAWSSSMRDHEAGAGVVCGAPETSKTDDHALLNPTMLVEVLSPSTEALIGQTEAAVIETMRMHANWTVLLAIVLLGSCSSQSTSDGDKSEMSAGRALAASVGVGDASLQIRYSTGIRSIFEDSKGRFWFGSHQEGVCRYDGHELTYYTVSDGLSDNQVRTIQEDQAGVIWFETGNGITSFDGDEFEIRTGRNHGSPVVASGNAWHKEAGDLWFSGDSGMRAGFDGQGVYRYDGRSLSYLAFPLPHGVEEGNPYLVTGIVKGRDGTVWFGTYPGVLGYDGRSFTVINDETAGIEPGSERLHVRSIFEDSRGKLWMGNNGLGVLIYDGQTVSNFTEQHGLSIREKGPSGSLARIFSIAEDAAGNIWFGTRDNGAWRFDGESLTNFTIEDGLTSHMVWTIYRDKRGALWFGMGDGSVCRFNGKSFDRIY